MGWEAKDCCAVFACFCSVLFCACYCFVEIVIWCNGHCTFFKISPCTPTSITVSIVWSVHVLCINDQVQGQFCTDTCTWIGQVFSPFLFSNNNKAIVQPSWPNIYYMAKGTFFFLLLFCSVSQSGPRICFILPARWTSCMIIIGIITWYKPSRSISM